MSAIWKGPKNGSRKPNVLRTMRSRSSRVVWPSSTIASASRSSAIWSRLETKPARSATSAGCLPTARRKSSIVSTVARSVAGPAITSMPGVHSGGLNQCTPRKRPGSRHRLGEPGDRQGRGVGGDDRRRRRGRDARRRICAFSSGSSGTASTTRSAPSTAASTSAAALTCSVRTSASPSSNPASTCPRVRSSSARARPLRQLRRRVCELHLQTVTGEVAGDAAAHRPAAEHGDRCDASHARVVPLSSAAHPSR